ncbi:lysozyme [Thetidibacter halocola]|uniref:lysozyme n=1 Tax=Thetidibacter halocola TaxID=2827239 RepID=UPI00201269BE|nr:lysozyme [Thetidibacter halocola]
MEMTDRGILALVRHEGIVPGPYTDVKQVWTFGIGHTAAAGEPDPAAMPRGMPANLDAGIREAFGVFRADLARYEAAVLSAVKVPLEPHEFDALVSFHYNTGGIAKAALNHLDLDAIEAREYALRAYDGALLMVSHDEGFLHRIGIARRVTLPLLSR